MPLRSKRVGPSPNVRVSRPARRPLRLAGVGRRREGVTADGADGAALGEERGGRGPRLEQRLEVGRIVADEIERREDEPVLLRRGDPGLVGAAERDRVAGLGRRRILGSDRDPGAECGADASRCAGAQQGATGEPAARGAGPAGGRIGRGGLGHPTTFAGTSESGSASRSRAALSLRLSAGVSAV